MLNGLIIDKSKEIINLRDIIKTDELYYKSRPGKTDNFVNTLYLLFSKRYI